MADQVQLKVPKAGYRLFNSKTWAVFSEGVWHNNPIFGMMLGLCSTLAVTNLMSNALVMSVSVTVVLVANSAIISALRNHIPDRVRMIVYMLIVSTLVITVDMMLRICLPDISKALGPYVALIITNCIIMGRAEAFAVNNTVPVSIADSLGVGAGYTFSLMIMAFFRESLGFGTIFGLKVLPEAMSPIQLFAIPPGAFFALGVFILVVNTLKQRQAKEDDA
ncbi:MAG: electron transport complex subunit RsxE [Lentisphaerae bacterium]|jgi:Na+-transporting NADH:ubiquinone oxidoreductase subunit D|nr:electron transport complex subunit RsxE [Lentisphaerota bacterium]MBT4816159.1 electron transport complex subunit RsxE [Lentisphaerota bacterium]MBT5605568.1 electron transport complex subunit RsxE [Lentisphaerota bacterium]MBT7056845.1 electron transport complex subunit RsxE [Lentisphaerota bacterium]MBT7845369.1 electron transport complex subunit RsxE [Lentisphaerota bacterium]